MPKLVTFIGTGDYKETYYTFADKKVYTRYFPVMAAEITRPAKILVVRTKEAQARHGAELRNELIKRGLTEPTSIEIPFGKSTNELWQIFNTLVDEVNQNDRVVFDITHSFRSQPLISFLSIAYLKFVKDVKIQALYYGAYEAKNESNESPVFDLTGFCSLLDWIIGVNSFVKHGSAQEISFLLGEAQRLAKEEQGPARRELRKFGKIIEDISRALFTNRPFEVTSETRKLNYYTGRSEQRELLERDTREWAAPFGVLIDHIINKLSPFAGPAETSDPENLKSHFEMVRWYVEHNYAPQALSMMRELVISEIMYRNNLYGQVFDRNARESAAYKLLFTGADTIPARLWSKLRGLRNDVIHTGWNEESRSSRKVMEETRACLDLLEQMFKEERVIPAAEVDMRQTEPVKVLVSPLGKSPGLLYTALHHINPERLFVLTSKEVRENYLEEIMSKAGYNGEIAVVEVNDPFAGFAELPHVIKELRKYFDQLPFHQMYINLTGGTTLLQHFVSRVAQMHVDSRVKTTTAAMIDRRPVKEQQDNPYVVGEIITVEESEM